jgi:hypothetical protein
MIAFEADSFGSEHRRLYIWSDDPGRNEPGCNGWSFQVTEFKGDEEVPLRDAWAATFQEILLYPPVYAPRDIQWRRAGTDEPVDIYGLAY